MFLLGGSIYGAIEVSFRGYTHWSMVITGGSAMLAIYMINEALPKMSIFIKAFAGSAVITVLELTVGMMVNRVFMMGVWDYSELPMNLMGQITPIFSLCWYALSIAGFYICGKINKIISPQIS